MGVNCEQVLKINGHAKYLSQDKILLDSRGSCVAELAIARVKSLANCERSQAQQGQMELPRIVLHFDINKTLIISDPASGAHFEVMINAILSELIWGMVGTVSHESLPTEQFHLWRPVSDEPTSTPPVDGAVSYEEFLEKHLRLERADRKHFKHCFTEKGQPGHRYRSFYDEIRSKLSLPIQSSELPTLQRGYYYILPSFYRLLLHLQTTQRDFRIVFRTFGSDMWEVAQELNAFCEGRHPCYPDVRCDGTDGRADLRIQLPHQSAHVTRVPHVHDHVFISYINREGVVAVTSGWNGVATALNEMLERSNTAGIRDHYAYWHAHGEADNSGKPLIVNSNDQTQVHVFLDDNIERDRAHAVDVRELSTGEPIPFQQTCGRYLCRVNPYAAIVNEDYFIQRISNCEAAIRESWK